MTKPGRKFAPSFATVHSSPGDLLGAGKAAWEWCGAAGLCWREAVLTGDWERQNPRAELATASSCRNREAQPEEGALG